MTAESIAVIGMACRFPGAPDLAAFRRLLREGREGVTDVPADRWEIEAWHDPRLSAAGKMISRRGGFVDSIRCFDHEFFGTSRNEAAWMDPQHRLLLETSWEALEDAAVTPERLRGARVGVYVGAGGHDYETLCGERARTSTAYSLTGNLSSLIANRVSSYFDFRGPSFTVDAACASSLLTMALACDALTAGTCDVALVGGVNVILHPHSSVAMSQAWILSPEGKCRAFDAKADGYVRGEGCGVLIVKRLEDAQRDGDPIRMVIRGWATNHGGRGDGLTKPNAAAQRAVIEEAWRRAQVTAGDFGYLEAFGVGSPTSDVAEARALCGLFGTGVPGRPPVYIGSVKSNIGHLEAAAGAASLIKMGLCLETREVVPQLHFEQLHPEIREAGFPFTIPQAVGAWPAYGAGHLGGVSAFAIGGVNVHLVVAAAPPPPPRPPMSGLAGPGSARAAALRSQRRAPAGPRPALGRRPGHGIACRVGGPLLHSRRPCPLHPPAGGDVGDGGGTGRSAAAFRRHGRSARRPLDRCRRSRRRRSPRPRHPEVRRPQLSVRAHRSLGIPDHRDERGGVHRQAGHGSRRIAVRAGAGRRYRPPAAGKRWSIGCGRRCSTCSVPRRPGPSATTPVSSSSG